MVTGKDYCLRHGKPNRQFCSKEKRKYREKQEQNLRGWIYPVLMKSSPKNFHCVFHLKRNRKLLNIDSLWAFLRFLYNNLHHNWFGNWESFHCSYILYSIFAFVRVNVFVFYIVLKFVYIFVVVIVLVFFICICTCNWKSNWFSLVGRQIWPWLESGPHNLFLLAAIILLWILNWTAKAASFGQLARHTKWDFLVLKSQIVLNILLKSRNGTSALVPAFNEISPNLWVFSSIREMTYQKECEFQNWNHKIKRDTLWN